MKIQTYNAHIRPGGQITHEVPKENLSAPEVILLRQIHGDDAVVHLSRAAKPLNVPLEQERDRLISIYGDKAVAAAFGNSYGSNLPAEVPRDWINGVEHRAPAQPPAEDPLQ